MLWTIRVALRRSTGSPRTPLARKYAVVADDPGTAMEMVKAELHGAEIVGEMRVDAHQSMIVRTF